MRKCKCGEKTIDDLGTLRKFTKKKNTEREKERERKTEINNEFSKKKPEITVANVNTNNR